MSVHLVAVAQEQRNRRRDLDQGNEQRDQPPEGEVFASRLASGPSVDCTQDRVGAVDFRRGRSDSDAPMQVGRRGGPVPAVGAPLHVGADDLAGQRRRLAIEAGRYRLTDLGTVHTAIGRPVRRKSSRRSAECRLTGSAARVRRRGPAHRRPAARGDENDDASLADAIRMGQREVTRFLRPLVDDCDLDDVVQDTFVRMYKALPRFRGDSSGRTWLLAIARRAAADTVRTNRRMRRTEHTSIPPADSVGMESTQALQGLIDALDPDRREAFVLTQLVGCSYAEAAQICGVKIGTIRSRVCASPGRTAAPGARRPERMSRRHLLLFACALVGTLLLDASPAGAHGTGGPPASNFHTVVRGLRPRAPGVDVRLGPDGEQMELAVTGTAVVTVLGYDHEPYLRISPRGVFENRRSRAVVINRSRIMTSVPVPIRRGPPEWVKVSGTPVARWHDHRVHWMGGSPPPSVTRDPDHAHLVDSWSIPLRVDAASAEIRGELRWEPPPAAWVWWLAAAAAAGAVLLGVRTRWRGTVLVLTLAIMGLAETLHAWGSWPFTPGATPDRLAEAIPSLAAIAACGGALVWLRVRGWASAAPGILIAGLFVAVSGGLADLPVLSHSWVPSRLDPTAARAVVALGLGLGTATAIFGSLHLRPPKPDVTG